MRASTLSYAISQCRKLLCLKAWPVKIYTDGQQYEIPSDGSTIIVIHSSRRPCVVSTYEYYSEPGNPLLSKDYSSMEEFMLGYFEVDIRRAANQIAKDESGFPPSAGESFSEERMNHFLQLQKETEQIFRKAIANKISEFDFRMMERYLWLSR